MSSSFNRKRKVNPGETVYKLSWCMGPPGAALQHQPLGPDEQPVEPLDAEGKRIPGFCPATSSRGSGADAVTTYCQCSCHGEDIPEAYPGYYASRTRAAAAAEDEDETAEGEEAAASAPSAEDSPSVETLTGVVAPPAVPVVAAVTEPPLPEMGNPLAPTPEAATDAPVSAQTPAWVDDGHARTETKSFAYPNGSVTRTERPSVTRQGKDVTLVEWIAALPDGTKIGTPQWSRKAAKDLLP